MTLADLDARLRSMNARGLRAGLWTRGWQVAVRRQGDQLGGMATLSDHWPTLEEAVVQTLELADRLVERKAP